MIDPKILLQALGRAWFIEPSQAQHYASVIENLFARDGKNIWQDLAVQPVSADFVFCVHPSANQQSQLSDAPAGSVAVISLSGAVMKYDFCGAPGTQSIMGMIDQVNQHPNIDAIILRIDSPGGAVDGTQALANKIKSSQKPVVAFVDGMMASAAMWFGSAASYRIASSSTDMIGSIGTMASWRDSSQLQKAAGIRIHEVYATASTNKNNEFRAANADTPDYQPMIDNILDPTNEQFMAAIKANIKNVNEEVFTGSIYLADKAKEMGLINQIGTMDDAVNKALQLATKKNKNIMEQNQRFAKVFTAIGAEQMEVLNEGIWITEAQMESIEQALNQSDAALQLAQDNVATVNGGLTEVQTALEAANDRIKELEAAIIPAADVPAGGDPDKSVKGFDKYKTSYDQEAQKIIALRDPK
jgi:signal peptide peptidase SppA